MSYTRLKVSRSRRTIASWYAPAYVPRNARTAAAVRAVARGSSDLTIESSGERASSSPSAIRRNGAYGPDGPMFDSRRSSIASAHSGSTRVATALRMGPARSLGTINAASRPVSNRTSPFSTAASLAKTPRLRPVTIDPSPARPVSTYDQTPAPVNAPPFDASHAANAVSASVGKEGKGAGGGSREGNARDSGSEPPAPTVDASGSPRAAARHASAHTSASARAARATRRARMTRGDADRVSRVVVTRTRAREWHAPAIGSRPPTFS